MPLTDQGTDGLITMFTDVLGISGSSVLFLMAILISIAVAAGIGMRFKNKTAAMGSFFLLMGFFAMIGWINWVIIIIPLILMGAYTFFQRDNK